MTITATTLAGAITASTTSFAITSATGVVNPNFQTGGPSTVTYLYIDQEIMLVVGVVGTQVSVVRGINGSLAAAHLNLTQVQVGGPGDFLVQNEWLAASTTGLQTIAQLVLPATFLSGATDAIPAGVAGTYIFKTAGVDAATLAAPTAAQEGNVIYISSDTTNVHTITTASLFANGAALASVATFKAFRGSNVLLRVCNLVYHVISSNVTSIT
jgi:hypothetical protein